MSTCSVSAGLNMYDGTLEKEERREEELLKNLKSTDLSNLLHALAGDTVDFFFFFQQKTCIS